MDTLINGTQKEKSELSFRLIDQGMKGFFNYNDFCLLIDSIISVWNSLTGTSMSESLNLAEVMKKRLENYTKNVFEKMDTRKENQVYLEDYVQALEQDPNLLEILDFMNRGIAENPMTQAAEKETHFQELKILKELSAVERGLGSLLELLSGKEQMKASMKSFDKNTSLFILPAEEKLRASLQDFNKIEKRSFQNDVIEKRSYSVFQNSKPIEPLKSPNGRTFLPLFLDNVNEISRQSMYEQQPQIRIHTSNPMPILDISDEEIDISFPNDVSNRMSVYQEKRPRFISVGRSQKSIKDIDLSENELRRDEIDFNLLPKPILVKLLQRSQEGISENLEVISQLRMIVEERLKGDNNNLRVSSRKEKSMKPDQLMSSTMNVPRVLQSSNTNRIQKKMKKKGLVFLGHQNWNLVLNMMLGIQTAVKSIYIAKGHLLTHKDFKLKYYFELIPRRIANEKESFKICKFFDYAPYVFYELRNIYGVSNDVYLKSIGPEHLITNLLKGDLQSLSELISSGKSGSFFYYTNDGKDD